MPETTDYMHVAGPDKDVEVKDAQPAQSLEQPDIQTSNVQQHHKDTGIISKHDYFFIGTKINTFTYIYVIKTISTNI